ncbi:hypothetical protein FRB96_006069 [Tulasnella sp. 330]|nr:hypothetical protein FRB96_006069 [Tulasnella sp. 330]
MTGHPQVLFAATRAISKAEFEKIHKPIHDPASLTWEIAASATHTACNIAKAGVHHTHDELPTISHASSFSDSSSISAPLRPPAEEHVRPQPRARSEEQKPLDGTFTADDFSAWLARSGMDDSSNVPSKGPIEAWNDDSADETTALMAHRRRRRALEGKGQQKKGPPNYIVANGGLPRSPVPSPTAGKQMQGGYGTLPQLEEEEDENESDTVSRASSKAEDSLINGAWSAGWSGGWQSTQSWWSKTRALFCCGSNTDRDDHFEN